MAFIPVPNVARLVMRMALHGQEIENVFYVLNDAGWGDGALLDVANAAANQWTISTGVLHQLSNTLTFKSAKITDLTSDSGLSAESFNGAGTAGSDEGVPFPNNVAFCIHKQAVIGGRHNKGRVYISGITNNHVDDANTMKTLVANALVSELQAFQDALEEAPAIHVGFVSYSDHNVPLTTGVFIPVVGYGYTDRTLDSQRRRLPGRGI